MAKNKNRDRGNKQTPPSSERGEQKSVSSIEDRTEQVQSRIAPSHDDTPKGRQKRFGHN